LVAGMILTLIRPDVGHHVGVENGSLSRHDWFSLMRKIIRVEG
jgi:hypothetical protein